MPSYSSATAKAVTPRSARVAHTLRPGSTSPAPHARTAAGTFAAPSAASMLDAKSRCWSSISKFMPRLPLAPVLARASLRSSLVLVFGCSRLRLPWQSQQPFGDDVALNLVGARVDRSAEGEQQSVGP